MKIRIEYRISIRCRLGRHDKGDAEHGCQGGFTQLFGATRFCMCKCHNGPSTPAPPQGANVYRAAADFERAFLDLYGPDPRPFLRPVMNEIAPEMLARLQDQFAKAMAEPDLLAEAAHRRPDDDTRRPTSTEPVPTVLVSAVRRGADCAFLAEAVPAMSLLVIGTGWQQEKLRVRECSGSGPFRVDFGQGNFDVHHLGYSHPAGTAAVAYPHDYRQTDSEAR